MNREPTLITGPAVEPVSLTEFRLYRRVDTTDEDDQLSALIRDARECLEQVTWRAFINQTWTQTFTTFGHRLWLPKPEARSISSIKYFNNSTAVAEVQSITITGTWATGDVANLVINGNTVTFTVAGTETPAAVVAGLVAAWNASTATDVAAITAADANPAITLTADTAGRAFRVTTSETTAGNGAVGDPSITTATRQTVTASIYELGDERGRYFVQEAFDQNWPSGNRGHPDEITVEFIAGYGPAALDVPRSIRRAVQFLAGNWYEERESFVVGSTVADLPFTVAALIKPYIAKDFREC